ncbi:putative thiamine-monophosphate kinase [Methanocella paludicola SANAE]|uniref:Thiamine-monophosphate kinase n=2 Tax=Methanocella TaxID=570266 RepID=D1YYI0_METPS|nr:putative thiamine-monophosphate kinase [Methanocella paludicola SANAE]
MLHRTTDFPAEMSGEDIGWMSVAVSLSDVASMGAKPIGVVAAMGIPGGTDVDFIDGLARGMRDCAKRYGTDIVGGDTDQHAELTIVTTALGRVEKDKLKLRSGARVGDLLCVTGYLGTPAAGYKVLIEGREAPEQDKKLLIDRFFRPQPRVEEGMRLSAYKEVTAMMDVSDGLGKSVYELSNSSKVGFLVDADRLPLLEETRRIVKSREELIDMAVCFGGEFELLFTLDPAGLDKINCVKFTVIGKVVETGLTLDDRGTMRPITCKGYEHLKKKSDVVH